MTPKLIDTGSTVPVSSGVAALCFPSASSRPGRWRTGGAMALLAAGLLLGGLSQAQVVPTTQTGSRTVNEWLSRMHEASRQRAYTGTLVVSAGATMSASKIWHVCDGNQQMERVDTLTGAPRTTIRSNNDVITFEPESRTALIEKRESLGMFPELLRTPSNLIPQFYTARETGVQRVAGHLADMVEILPRDDLRFGYRIWSERQTGLVVKLQTLGEQGTVLEQMAFSELDLNATVSMEKLQRKMKDTRGYEVHKPLLRKTTAEAEGWRLKDSVPGFTAMSCHTRDAGASMPPGTAPMQWIFSDGLASVSLFVEPFDPQRHGQEKTAAVGATHSVSRRVGDHWLTVLGEVPPSTLRRFALALERTR